MPSLMAGGLVDVQLSLLIILRTSPQPALHPGCIYAGSRGRGLEGRIEITALAEGRKFGDGKRWVSAKSTS